MINEIKVFDGGYAFLSNFYHAPLAYEGVIYQNSESAFQAQKCISIIDKFQFANLEPGKAKRLGKKVLLRKDWEDIKDTQMYEIVKAKFLQNPHLRDRLLVTGDAYLEEGNVWNDTYWGTYKGIGENKLGKILMGIRTEFKKGLI
jgi:ribA/ribD-fused uncharacterized protein